ncbi:TetR/AcrR family transcriptional regulator [Amycolatopsis taiwanensis]|uniref:TetR/AcrR family transcriptional regulator n=1 Tax=Amycolatopsis taiwanensis TaxID=342230 RepID=UPI0004B1329D|nr:TetR/AcrR family transcriptional regulator [Amycolatopsis taiwanensis]
MQKRGEQRRRLIIDAAIDLFGRQGYRGTGLAAIAQRAGITPSAVIHHFGSKEGLLRAVLDEHDARSAERLSQYVGKGVRGLIDALLDNAEHMRRHIHLATLHATLQAEHLAADPGNEVRDRFLQRSRQLRRAMANILRTAIRTGELANCPDPEAVAAEILAFQEGALILWRLDPGDIDLRALYQTHLGRLIIDARN